MTHKTGVLSGWWWWHIWCLPPPFPFLHRLFGGRSACTWKFGMQRDTIDAFDFYCFIRFLPFVFIRWLWYVGLSVPLQHGAGGSTSFSPKMWRFVRASAFLPKIPLDTCLLFMKSGFVL